MTSETSIQQTGTILDRIVADKKERLQEQMRTEPLDALQERITTLDEQWTLLQALRTPRGFTPAGAKVQIIAEIKKASPSKGVLATAFDYLGIARAYARAGAAGISVLTEEKHFLGHLEHMRAVRSMLAKEFAGARPSVLRKDFLTHPYEIVQSRAYGADNLLLIVALLETTLLRDLVQQARELAMAALVEVHDESEAERAVAAGAELFGINNRDLRTFRVDLSTTERIRPLLPETAVVVGESGVLSRHDARRLQQAGIDAILAGEAFMTAPDVKSKMEELRP